MAPQASRIFSKKSWIDLLTRGDTWFFLDGGLYLQDRGGTNDYHQSVGHHPFPGTNGKLFRRVGTSRDQTLPRPPSLLISGLGRFGNGIQQLLHAVSFARSFGASDVMFFPNATTGKRPVQLDIGVSLRPVSAPFRRRNRQPKLIWRSDFFMSGMSHHSFDVDASLSIRPGLQKLYHPLIDNQAPDDGKLTIHLRSGDVFGRSPHADYGQPPFAFYKLVIDSADWESILIVTEDDAHPCRDAIVTYSVSKGIVVEITGRTVAEATRAISGSRHLIASRGTFVPALIFLSEINKTVHEFDSEIDRIPSPIPHSYCLIRDKSGSYRNEILSRNWSNSTNQREMMLEYPEEFLETAPPH